MPRVPVSFLIPVYKSLEPKLGERWLADAGLTREELYRPDKLEVERFDGLSDSAARLANRSDLGLEQGRQADWRQLGPVALVLQNAPTAGQALSLFRRYNTLVCTGVDYQVSVEGTKARCLFLNAFPGRHLPRVVRDAVMQSFLTLLGQLVDAAPVVLEAEVEHAAADAEAYRRLWGVVPRFGRPHSAFTLDASLLERPVAFSDPLLLEQFRARADALLPKTAEATSSRVRRVLAERWGRPIALSEAASALALAPRTLQKRLAAESTSYQEVSDAFRRDFSEAELRRGELSVGEIAWMAGYSEQSAFQAAFKRWTGMTPRGFRAKSAS